ERMARRVDYLLEEVLVLKESLRATTGTTSRETASRSGSVAGSSSRRLGRATTMGSSVASNVDYASAASSTRIAGLREAWRRVSGIRCTNRVWERRDDSGTIGACRRRRHPQFRQGALFVAGCC